MNRQDKDLDATLDGALAEIRDEQLDERTAEAIAARVWERVEREARQLEQSGRVPRPITDYEALIPAYVAGRLSEARRILVEDQMRESVSFRRKVLQARAGGAAPERALPRAARSRVIGSEWSWAIAAALLVAVTFIGLKLDLGVLSVRTGGVVTIRKVDGELLRVNEAGMTPLRPGDTVRLVPGRDAVRTAKDSRAMLELSDGSQVEMNERSQLSVVERHGRFGGERKDSTIELDRGSVIVEAARQGEARLRVRTADCAVEVKGTVFSVNHGLKGSRVSVIEGEVRVRTRRTDVLRPGDQVSTNPSVGRVPLEQEIAWSQQLDRHVALLRELTQLGQELDWTVAGPSRRHSTRLLDLAPADTVVYAAIPNLSGALGEAYDLVRSKVDSNPVLHEWWERSVVPAGADANLERAVAKIRSYGLHFGEEIQLTLQMDPANEVQEPVILAEVMHPAELRELLHAELDQLAPHAGPGTVVLEGEIPTITRRTSSGPHDAFFMWIHDGLFAASPRREPIERVAASVAAGGSAFAGTPFHARLAELYRDGVEWALGVDLRRILGHAADRAAAERTGLLDVQHLIVRHREAEGHAETEAVLTFEQPRRGIASWLAEPGPMGSLEFVSQDASMVAAFVIKTPSALIEDLLSIMAASDGELPERLEAVEREHGLDLRRDIADPLGGEFAFALDGPLLPKPSWKLVVEVYDFERLEHSIELVLERLNASLAEHGKPGFRLEHVDAGDRVYHAIHSAQGGMAVHYVFADGYLVAAPSRVLLDRALGLRGSGLSLPRSPRFVALLPQDGRLNFSALAYENLGPVVGPLASSLGSMADRLSPDQVAMIEALARETSASLAYAYGERNRIVMAASSQQGLFSSGLGLLQLHSLMEMPASIGTAVEQQQREREADPAGAS
jgi:hypothetical protein